MLLQNLISEPFKKTAQFWFMGMHWRTYDRLAERHQQLDNVWAIGVLRRLGRFI